MSTRLLILLIASLGTVLFAGIQQSKEQEDIPGAKPNTRKHAEAKIIVRSSNAKPYDQTVTPYCWRAI